MRQSQKNAVRDFTAGEIRARPHQHIVADAHGMTVEPTDHRSIHDDAVCTDLDRPAFRCQDGTETDRAVRADRNVAANNGRWRNPRRRMDARGDSIVVEKHHCLLFFASLAAGRVTVREARGTRRRTVQSREP